MLGFLMLYLWRILMFQLSGFYYGARIQYQNGPVLLPVAVATIPQEYCDNKSPRCRIEGITFHESTNPTA